MPRRACTAPGRLRLPARARWRGRRSTLSPPAPRQKSDNYAGAEGHTFLVLSWSWMSERRLFSLEKVLIRCWSSARRQHRVRYDSVRGNGDTPHATSMPSPSSSGGSCQMSAPDPQCQTPRSPSSYCADHPQASCRRLCRDDHSRYHRPVHRCNWRTDKPELCNDVFISCHFAPVPRAMDASGIIHSQESLQRTWTFLSPLCVLFCTHL
jgi:hypothetical protein